VGLGWRVPQTLGLFTKYRFSYVSPAFEDTVQGVPFSVDTDLATDHELVRIVPRF
jgi:hypothetical protein